MHYNCYFWLQNEKRVLNEEIPILRWSTTKHQIRENAKCVYRKGYVSVEKKDKLHVTTT